MDLDCNLKTGLKTRDTTLASQILEDRLLKFPLEPFLEMTVRNLRESVRRHRSKGLVFGASGGIDSLVCAALCALAGEKGKQFRVVGLQMNDSRVKTESYNPEIYASLGVELIFEDITTEAIAHERRSGMPPRWLTVALMKIALRWVPKRARQRLILATKAGTVPRQVLTHFQLLTLLHRLRIARLKAFAMRDALMLIICANRTEAALGYFVENGVDDPIMGDYAPISRLYKSQVIRLARFLGLPEKTILQRPSPGFGGIYDDQILGPYDLVDLVLVGMELGYMDEEIGKAIEHHIGKCRPRGFVLARPCFDTRYVRFLKRLAGLSSLKRAE